MVRRSVVTLAAEGLKDATSWWDKVDESPLWQDRIFHVLAGLYAAVAAVALIQLVRIQMRVPEYGWTTQKVFHFLNFLVNGVRSVVFLFRRDVQKLHPEVVQHVVLDVPSLAFFTTYALLVLFWAEIYYQARAVSTDHLRPNFYTINGIVFAIQVVMWLILWWKPTHAMVALSKMFFAGVSLFAALGFLLFGGRLFLMLQRFPEESKGRSKKLQEVGYVTTICFSCFLIRCIMECLNAFDKAANLDVLDHPILNLLYYLVCLVYVYTTSEYRCKFLNLPIRDTIIASLMTYERRQETFGLTLQLVEILPSSLVLFILRKLPPKRGITQYHPIQ